MSGVGLSWSQLGFYSVCYCDFCIEINHDMQIFLHRQGKPAIGLLELCRTAMSQNNAKKYSIV